MSSNKRQLSKDTKRANMKNPSEFSMKRPQVDESSRMGYRDDSPYRNAPYLDINTPNGIIDMSGTGVPLMANGILLPPYSGQHQFNSTIVRETPYYQEGGSYVPQVKGRMGRMAGTDEEGRPTEISHKMRAEFIPEVGWVGFPTVFQNPDSSWLDMSDETKWGAGWYPVYEEALRRNEVYNFGNDEKSALDFGMGSWKSQFPKEQKAAGGEIMELDDDEIAEYKRLGYSVEIIEDPTDEESLQYFENYFLR